MRRWSEAPVDRLGPPSPPPNPLPQGEGGFRGYQKTPPPLAGRGRGEGAQTTQVERATQAAAAAATLDQLRAAIAAFDGCMLRDTASHLIFAEGDPAPG